LSWSYSGDPSASDLDRVRWLIGDTDEDHQEVTDEEIGAALDLTGNVIGAAVEVLDALIAKYSYQTDYGWSGDYSESASQRVAQLRRRRRELARRRAMPLTTSDDDLHATRFDVGMHDSEQI